MKGVRQATRASTRGTRFKGSLKDQAWVNLHSDEEEAGYSTGSEQEDCTDSDMVVAGNGAMAPSAAIYNPRTYQMTRDEALAARRERRRSDALRAAAEARAARAALLK